MKRLVNEVDSLKPNEFKPSNAHQPKKASRLKVTDTRIKEFFSFWAGEYRPRFGSGYVFTGKDGANVKRVLRTHDLPRLKDLASLFFNSKEKWITETGGYTIGVFASQINELVSTSRAPSSPQQELPA